MARFVRWYGSNPLHLLVPICSFALTAYAMVRLFAIRPLAVAVWFVGAAIVYDLVLLPRWPIITGVLFGASAVAYAFKLRQSRRAARIDGQGRNPGHSRARDGR
ncbi:hypothetical protein [Streptomyces sp. NPDC002547]